MLERTKKSPNQIIQQIVHRALCILIQIVLRLSGGVGKQAAGCHGYKVIREGRVVREGYVSYYAGESRKGERGRSKGKGRP